MNNEVFKEKFEKWLKLKIFYCENDRAGGFLKKKRYTDKRIVELVERLRKGEVMSGICIAEKEEDLE